MSVGDKHLAEVLSDVIEKTVVIQSSQSDSIASIKESLRMCFVRLDNIDHQFTNGFRSDIKNHATNSLTPVKEQIEEIEQKLDNAIREIRSFRKLGFWAKVLASFLVTISGIAYAAAELSQSMASKDQSAVEKRMIQKLDESEKAVNKMVSDMNNKLDSLTKREKNVSTSSPAN